MFVQLGSSGHEVPKGTTIHVRVNQTQFTAKDVIEYDCLLLSGVTCRLTQRERSPAVNLAAAVEAVRGPSRYH